MKMLKVFGAVLGLATVCHSSQAGVVLQNDFSSVSTVNTTVTSGTNFGTGFSTGVSDQTLEFVSTTFVLGKTGANASSTPIVKLYADNGFGSPGALLDVLTLTPPPVISTTPGEYTFVPSGANPILTPSTSYFLTLEANPTEPFQWYFANGAPTEQNSSTWSATNGIRSTNGGAAWSPFGLAGTGAVRIQAVPEPSSLAIVIGAAGSIAGWRLRRSKQGDGAIAI